MAEGLKSESKKPNEAGITEKKVVAFIRRFSVGIFAAFYLSLVQSTPNGIWQQQALALFRIELILTFFAFLYLTEYAVEGEEKPVGSMIMNVFIFIICWQIVFPGFTDEKGQKNITQQEQGFDK